MLSIGPIPADAGEPAPPWPLAQMRKAYPRGRGGASARFEEAREGAGLSPRTRGSRTKLIDLLDWVGPIPADAGEP